MTVPSTIEPPELDGFEHLRYLGGGGFADVFLYQQRRPSRQVAVKVLKSSATNAVSQADFDAEADLMASVSAHPFIVTVFDAGISADGRPFLVMEYYRNEHLGIRAQQGMSVAEVLRVGVQVGSAVETLHQAGIVHRDIKPANILVSEFKKPGLTDFGIAGISAEDEESRGASIPYAPPEVVSGRSNGDERADVYALGATLYTLLARRTPFESGNPARGELIQRILTSSPPPIERPDVPRQLELLLQQALSKDPDHRPRSAAAFATALQAIEREQRLDPTPLEVREIEPDTGTHNAPESERTRSGSSGPPPSVTPSPFAPPAPEAPADTPAAGPSPVAPPPALPAPAVQQQPPAAATVARPAVARPQPHPAATPDATVARPVAAVPAQPLASELSAPPSSRVDQGGTVVRPPSVPSVLPAAEPDDPPSGGGWKLAVGGVVVAAAVAAGVVLLSGGGTGSTTPPRTPPTPAFALADLERPGVPTNVHISRSGADWIATWSDSGTVTPHYWQVARSDGFAPASPQVVQVRRYVIKGMRPGQNPCIMLSAGVKRTSQWSDEIGPLCGPR